MTRLGVNVDHIATLRNARGENDPNLMEMLFEVYEGGADGITFHLREDRRHIQDQDAIWIIKESPLPSNLEMALTPEMVEFALKYKPSSVCLVPEKREELTTEGGLNLTSLSGQQKEWVQELLRAQIRVFLFIDATAERVQQAAQLKATGVEVHTGPYAHSFTQETQRKQELQKLQEAEKLCRSLSMEFHAGHGLNRFNLPYLVQKLSVEEVNIGHAIVARSIKLGLRQAVSEIKRILTT